MFNSANIYRMPFQSTLSDTVYSMLLPSTKEIIKVLGIDIKQCRHNIDTNPYDNNITGIFTILPIDCHCNHCGMLMPNSFDNSFFFLAEPSGGPSMNPDRTPYIVCIDCIDLYNLESSMYFRPKYLANIHYTIDKKHFLKYMLVRMVFRKYVARWLIQIKLKLIERRFARKVQFLTMISILKNKLILEH